MFPIFERDLKLEKIAMPVVRESPAEPDHALPGSLHNVSWIRPSEGGDQVGPACLVGRDDKKSVTGTIDFLLKYGILKVYGGTKIFTISAVVMPRVED